MHTGYKSTESITNVVSIYTAKKSTAFAMDFVCYDFLVFFS